MAVYVVVWNIALGQPSCSESNYVLYARSSRVMNGFLVSGCSGIGMPARKIFGVWIKQKKMHFIETCIWRNVE